MDEQEELIQRLTRFYREARNDVPSTAPTWMPGQRRNVRWLQPVLASIALVILAAGVTVSIRMVRDQATRAKITPTPTVSAVPTPSASPSPSASATSSWVTSRIPIGQVWTMSLDPSAVFALYAPGPTAGRPNPSETKLARIDRASGAVTTAGPFPSATLLARVTAGLWIGAGANQATPGADTQWLTLLDPTTLTLKRRVRLPGQPDPNTYSPPQLAGTSNWLWSGYGHSLYRLDPTTGRVLLTKTLPGTVASISIDPLGQRLYLGVDAASNPNAQALVIELDGSSGASLASAPTGGAGLGGPQVAAAPDGVWIAYATGMMGAVEHRTAKGLSLLSEADHGHTNGIHAFVAAAALWLVDSMAQRVSCADLRTGTIAASSQEMFPELFVGDSKGSYIGDADGVGFLRPDPACPH